MSQIRTRLSATRIHWASNLLSLSSWAPILCLVSDTSFEKTLTPPPKGLLCRPLPIYLISISQILLYHLTTIL